jgi:hypothetical protein
LGLDRLGVTLRLLPTVNPADRFHENRVVIEWVRLSLAEGGQAAIGIGIRIRG